MTSEVATEVRPLTSKRFITALANGEQELSEEGRALFRFVLASYIIDSHHANSTFSASQEHLAQIEEIRRTTCNQLELHDYPHEEVITIFDEVSLKTGRNVLGLRSPAFNVFGPDSFELSAK
ncbi:MAG: hypothetical protein NUV69_04630 [Candidatus Curtissbacteria bacterium]|nr:hypothetical protein [Candidatus Curtissbacteria bacterium]